MTRSFSVVTIVLLFATQIFAACTPGVLSDSAITLLPPPSALTIGFGSDYTLAISTNVEQTTIPRVNFTYEFGNPSTATVCSITTPTLGSEITDTDDSCLVPVQSTFTWPPSADCFDVAVVGTNDVFSSELRLSWDEFITVQGINFSRPLSVEYNVQVAVPNQITFSSEFVTSSSSTVNFISGFLITGLNFELVSPTVVDFSVDIGTITAKDGANTLAISVLTPLTSGTNTQVGLGSAQGDFWVQLWDWQLAATCDGVSTYYIFRAEFICAAGVGPSNVNCTDAQYAGEFQDIVVNITASTVCPSTNITDFVATATLLLKNEDGVVATTFSNLDTISAEISAITNEAILTSTTVVSVTVNGNLWTEGDQYDLDDTDVKHPILNFAPTATLLTSTDLLDGTATPNTIEIVLDLEWSQGGVNKRALHYLRDVPLAPKSTASKKFQIKNVLGASVDVEGSASTLANGVAVLLALVGVFFAL
eukprot:TRINITY_DN650_c0_g1_i4.p1 TRINITY_DN650_c0_g1~~TRINITY_DN650_c0_g1_i4.p1  ORF type:complete len:492 (+),score=129.90 TRINITY_DN650_c0_g1_i4:43-1476(+)